MATWPLLDASVSEQGGSVPATSLTVAVTASGTAFTKGSWVELIAATAAGYSAMVITVDGIGTNGADTSTVLDIGVGGSGSEVVLVPDLMVGCGVANGKAGFHLPIRVPAGTRISARIASAVTSKVINCQIHMSGGGVVPQESASRAVTYGVNAGASSGVALSTVPSVHTEGAWTEIVAATTSPGRLLLPTLQVAGTSVNNSDGLIDIAVGASGSEVVVMTDLSFRTSTTETISYPSRLAPFRFPAGTRIAARYQSSNNSSGSKPIVAVTVFD